MLFRSRISCGPGRQLAAQHSHSWEPMFAAIPGLKILSAGTIEDARYMLGFALKENNPVIIFEYTGLLNSKSNEKLNTISSPFQSIIRKPGKDISLITYGQGVPKSLAAAEAIISEGIEVEVIDLRCLRPLDKKTIVSSVQKTHRAIIVEDAWKTMGIGAEISALISEHAFYELDAPVIVGGCATYPAALHLMRTGAAGVLVGFGGGAASTTRNVLGIHAPMATAVADVAGARRDYMDESGGRYVHVIADGGLGTSGDIVKAIACGAEIGRAHV